MSMLNIDELNNNIKQKEKKQNRNTLRTRAGNRGGSVLRRGKNQ